MKEVLKMIIGAAMLLLIAYFTVWPVINRLMIENRIKGELASPRTPFSSLRTIDISITVLDHPYRVFEVLWKMAITGRSTALERKSANHYLCMMAARQWGNSTELYDSNDWANAFDDLVKAKQKKLNSLSSEELKLLDALVEIRSEADRAEPNALSKP